MCRHISATALAMPWCDAQGRLAPTGKLSNSKSLSLVPLSLLGFGTTHHPAKGMSTFFFMPLHHFRCRHDERNLRLIPCGWSPFAGATISGGQMIVILTYSEHDDTITSIVPFSTSRLVLDCWLIRVTETGKVQQRQ
ncbi:hypothetical protein N657DRAFT_341601 [Parathielavia appendiculata]|uniref:Uncharacterized protein n=1 Tax=Parathielavia appendiculata TaxID=2587402 RepID=A0AAN6U205_9PEZI|nr:hypothetical protein N657DRAFT_341601 [Parathielavia appendiculata]